MNLFRKYIAILFLAVFLFPLLEKEVHALEHEETIHCKATDQHFHELEHLCSICDFIVPVTTAPAESGYDFSPFVSASLLFCYDEADVVSATRYFISLRGPPLSA